MNSSLTVTNQILHRDVEPQWKIDSCGEGQESSIERITRLEEEFEIKLAKKVLPAATMPLGIAGNPHLGATTASELMNPPVVDVRNRSANRPTFWNQYRHRYAEIVVKREQSVDESTRSQQQEDELETSTRVEEHSNLDMDLSHDSSVTLTSPTRF